MLQCVCEGESNLDRVMRRSWTGEMLEPGMDVYGGPRGQKVLLDHLLLPAKAPDASAQQRVLPRQPPLRQPRLSNPQRGLLSKKRSWHLAG